jgi:hypothetical protein
MRVEWPTEAANNVVTDPKFGEKMHALLEEIKAETAYFETPNGNRGGYIVVNMNDASQMPALAEPFYLWLDAKVNFIPVMLPEDLGKAGPSIAAAARKWGSQK